MALNDDEGEDGDLPVPSDFLLLFDSFLGRFLGLGNRVMEERRLSSPLSLPFFSFFFLVTSGPSSRPVLPDGKI